MGAVVVTAFVTKPYIVRSVRLLSAMTRRLIHVGRSLKAGVVFGTSFSGTGQADVRSFHNPNLRGNLRVLDSVGSGCKLHVAASVRRDCRTRTTNGMYSVLRVPTFLYHRASLLMSTTGANGVIGVGGTRFLDKESVGCPIRGTLSDKTDRM